MVSKTLPKHVAFIVDGNRRWAQRQGLPAITGHEFVVEKVIDSLVLCAVELGIPYLTFWVFSTENWRRGKSFAQGLFTLLKKGIAKRAAEYTKKGYRLKVIGDLSGLPEDLEQLLLFWQQKSAKGKKITVTTAINYGGRDEIIRAVRKMAKDFAKKNNLTIKQFNNLTMKKFSCYLDTAGMPDPDLIIRTGGESRFSGFLLWQSQYAELYFTNTLMPDFDAKEFDKALDWFGKRERRFGK